MKLFFLPFLLSLILCSFAALTDISDLEGEPQFRSVKLHWKYSKNVPDAFGFIVTYCEDQAWGKYRCKDKVINQAEVIATQDDNFLHFETDIDGLRMATNYTIEVNPMHAGISRPKLQRGRSLGGHIFIQTKGFHARAINCLSNTSFVDIETGPYFGGKISVEGTTNESCSVEGNAKSSQTSYMLTINHQICGSELRNSSVRTFVIVQENLPILTHSTRRFMVVCNYVPETFTVRAGVHLPDYDASPSSLMPIGHDIHEVDPSEFLDSSNSLFNSRVGKQIGRALRLSSDKAEDAPIMRNKDSLILSEKSISLPEALPQIDFHQGNSALDAPELDFLAQAVSSATLTPEPQKWAHIVLMIVLVMSAVIGLSCAALHFIRNSRHRSNNGFVTPQSEPSIAEINENLEAVLRDINGELDCEPRQSNLLQQQQPSVALNGVDYQTGNDRLFVITPAVIDHVSDSTGLITDVDDLNILYHDLNRDLVPHPDFIVSEQFEARPLVAIDHYTYSDLVANTMSSIPSYIPAGNSLSVPVNNLENIDGIFDDQNIYFQSEPAVLYARDSEGTVAYPLYPTYAGTTSPPPEYTASDFSAEILLQTASSDSDSDTSRSSLSSNNSSSDVNDSLAERISYYLTDDEGPSNNDKRTDNVQLTNEEPSTIDNSTSKETLKCLSTASLGGIETNWQLMDDEGSVFPAISV